MGHHYIRKCRHCFTTVAQCRCGSQKTVQFTVCSKPACQAQEKAALEAATRVQPIGPAPEAPTVAGLQAQLAAANAQIAAGAERERQLAELLKATEERLASANELVAEYERRASTPKPDGSKPGDPHCFSHNSLGVHT